MGRGKGVCTAITQHTRDTERSVSREGLHEETGRLPGARRIRTHVPHSQCGSLSGSLIPSPAFLAPVAAGSKAPVIEGNDATPRRSSRLTSAAPRQCLQLLSLLLGTAKPAAQPGSASPAAVGARSGGKEEAQGDPVLRPGCLSKGQEEQGRKRRTRRKTRT